MIQAKAVLSTIVCSTIACSLCFSYSSVASTHTSAQGSASLNMLGQGNQGGVGFDSAEVAMANSEQFSALAEFARQASGFQHESGGTLVNDVTNTDVTSIRASSADAGSGDPLYVIARHRGFTTKTENNSSIMWGESGTLMLITLGFAALGLSRRRIKLTGIASNQAGVAGSNAAVGSGSFHGNPLQRRLFAGEDKAVGKGTEDNAIDAAAQTSNGVQTTTNATDRNPYPELAESVHKLEALAQEMAHRS